MQRFFIISQMIGEEWEKGQIDGRKDDLSGMILTKN